MEGVRPLKDRGSSILHCYHDRNVDFSSRVECKVCSLSPHPGTIIDVLSSDEISVINEKYEGTPTVTTSSEGTSTNPSGSSTPQKCSGYWGEKCTEGDKEDIVNVEKGLEEFDHLRLELTKTRTTRHPEAPELNKEADLIEFLTQAQEQDDRMGRHGKKLGVAYKGLTVKGIDAQTSFVKTFPDAILGSLGPDLWRFIQKWILRRTPGASGASLRTLIHDFSGVVRGGEVSSFMRFVFIVR